MNPELHQRAKQIFLEVCDVAPTARAIFLDEQCAGDSVLRAAVEALLASDSDPIHQLKSIDAPAIRSQLEEFIAGAQSGSASTPGVSDPQADPERIGPYRIRRRLGEGGFGTVYEAAQSDPVRRTVAIKVVKLGMDTRQVIARFEAERQALAMMDHPNIARVLDAGTTEAGRPYFVMELVSGPPITQYCDAHKLGLKARLELFASVCQAVQHAHQKGIIHRDIKPTNVLVSTREGRAVPKVIDFGIARAMDTEAGAQSLFTQQGQLVGTPEYMSPEQAVGGWDIDTRTDVYSLGVLLYELLTGTTPLQLDSTRRRHPSDLQRAICDVDPPAPSARLKTLGDSREQTASNRGMSADSLQRLIRSDLDWIVIKALEKDRSRRYETVNGLVQDVIRYLSDEPVIARPPTASYRFRKFARRHRGPLMAGVAMFALLVGGIVGTTVGLVRSQEAEARAQTEAEIARAVNNFLNDDLLAAAAPDRLGNDVSMRRAVELASEEITGRFNGKPEVEAAVRLTLGRTFRELADLNRAKEQLERCRSLRMETLGGQHADTLEATHELGHVYVQLDRNPEGEALFREAHEGRMRIFGEQHRATISSLYELSVAIGEQARYHETEELMMRALHACRRHLGATDPLTLTVIRGVGVLHSTMGQIEKAGPYYDEAYQSALKALGPEHPTTLLSLRDVAVYYGLTGRNRDADSLLTQGLAVSKRVRGEEHPATLTLMASVAMARFRLGRDDEAEILYKNALAAAERTMPPGHTVTTGLQAALAGMYAHQERFELAEPLFLASIEGRERNLGPLHPLTLQVISQLVSHYRTTNQADRAAPWIERLGTAEDQGDRSVGHSD